MAEAKTKAASKAAVKKTALKKAPTKVNMTTELV